jgi:hypothetical protein
VHYLPIAACNAANTAAVGHINTARRFPMMNKTKLVFAALLLLQIAPAAQAASKGHHSNSSGLSAYDYAQEVYSWDGGLYPFNLAPGSSRPIPLRSGDKCWGSMGNGNLGWLPC